MVPNVSVLWSILDNSTILFPNCTSMMKSFSLLHKYDLKLHVHQRDQYQT